MINGTISFFSVIKKKRHIFHCQGVAGHLTTSLWLSCLSSADCLAGSSRRSRWSSPRASLWGMLVMPARWVLALSFGFFSLFLLLPVLPLFFEARAHSLRQAWLFRYRSINGMGGLDFLGDVVSSNTLHSKRATQITRPLLVHVSALRSRTIWTHWTASFWLACARR